jgi:hypothetical protein
MRFNCCEIVPCCVGVMALIEPTNRRGFRFLGITVDVVDARTVLSGSFINDVIIELHPT